MLKLLPLLLLFACNQPVKQPTVKADPAPFKLPEKSKQLQNDVLTMMKYMGTRDSFMMEKSKYEILYYRTEKEKYRIRGNRCIDSAAKYNKMFDSISNKLK